MIYLDRFKGGSFLLSMPGSLLLLGVLGHPGERLKLLLQRVLALKPFVLLV